MRRGIFFCHGQAPKKKKIPKRLKLSKLPPPLHSFFLFLSQRDPINNFFFPHLPSPSPKLMSIHKLVQSNP